MLVAIFTFDSSMYNIVSITFTVLILTELLNVAFEIHTWHWMMIVSEVLTLILYFVSMVILKSYFGISLLSLVPNASQIYRLLLHGTFLEK